MFQKIDASDEGPGLFNAVAIGLAVKILSGRLDDLKDSPGYKELLDEFAKDHPNFQPKTWDTLKIWLEHYNNSKDLELLLVPVLFHMSQKYQKSLESKILAELTSLVSKNPGAIKNPATKWYEFDDKSSFAMLDNLELKYREGLLIQLRKILKDYEGSFNPSNIKEFLEQKAEEIKGIISDLKPKITSTPNAYQQSYSCNDLKGLADALSLSLIEKQENERTYKSNKIYLKKNPLHWTLLCKDDDVDYYINRYDRKLQMSFTTALAGTEFVAAPSPEEINNNRIVIKNKEIDNPKGGNCAFYSFALGLIDIIQEEKVYNSTAMFDQWAILSSDLDCSVSKLYEAICAYDFNKPNKKLLDVLQASLRWITYRTQLTELREACSKSNVGNRFVGLADTDIYNKFVCMYYGKDVDGGPLNPDYNEFVDNELVKEALSKIDRNDVVEGLESLILGPLFLKLLYGEDVALDSITEETEPVLTSPVIHAMSTVVNDSFWGRVNDLKYLVTAFNNIRLHILQNGVKPYDIKDDKNDNDAHKYVITVNNISNRHWTTKIMVAIAAKGDKNIEKKKQSLENVSFLSKPQNLKNSFLSFFSFFTGSSTDSQKKAPKEKKAKQNVTNETQPDQIKLKSLKEKVSAATDKYCDYSEKIWFSIFHRHWPECRARAKRFNDLIAGIGDYESAKKELLNYLKNKKNGNTYPHSFRTMLLDELLESEPKVPLKTLSQTFESKLEELEEQLHPPFTSLVK